MSNPDWDDWPAWTELVVIGIPPELLADAQAASRGQPPTTDEDDGEPERLGSAALAYLDELDD